MAMANSKGPSTMRSMMYNGKHSLLPPKSPFPSTAPSYADYVSNSAIGPNGPPKYRDVNPHHQRTSSESFLIEEQPSWLDDLLNEPETPTPPVRRGHRRSSSDSFTYMEAANAAYNEYQAQTENRLRNLTSAPSWGSQDFDLYKDFRNPGSFYAEPNAMIKSKNRGAWDLPQNASKHNFVHQASVSLSASREGDGNTSIATNKKEAVESARQDADASERKDSYSNKGSVSDTDTKRAKQQFAQRSRVRKLQYIAELEKNVQALQAEGSEVSAEVEFLNQQSLILGMENKALKQRLDNLAQEQLIKYMEHEVLERELGRLRALYQQQQQPPQPIRRTASKDKLDAQFSNLSLKNNSGSTSDVSGPLHI
ncbi:putative transcription factor bZIP family [Helianthus debilis subsp. tardiflorus]